jgi:hypothetical protein
MFVGAQDGSGTHRPSMPGARLNTPEAIVDATGLISYVMQKMARKRPAP